MKYNVANNILHTKVVEITLLGLCRDKVTGSKPADPQFGAFSLSVFLEKKRFFS
jgi:hypothetical protein